MYGPDEEHTVFIIDNELYYYKAIPFGLKNMGTTYLKLVNTVFMDLIGKKVESYIDEMVVKTSKRKSDV